MQNYYLCLQIARLINQFVKRSMVMVFTPLKFTVKHIWGKILRPVLASYPLEMEKLMALKRKVSQIRLYT